MALRTLTLFPDLLYYRGVYVLDGVEVTIDFRFSHRLDAWFLDFFAPDGAPIVRNRRAVDNADLVAGVDDPRLPDGLFIPVPPGDGHAMHRTLGAGTALVYLPASEAQALIDEADGEDWRDPRRVWVLP